MNIAQGVSMVTRKAVRTYGAVQCAAGMETGKDRLVGANMMSLVRNATRRRAALWEG